MELIQQYMPVVIPVLLLIMSEMMGMSKKWKSNSIFQMIMVVLKALNPVKKKK